MGSQVVYLRICIDNLLSAYTSLGNTLGVVANMRLHACLYKPGFTTIFVDTSLHARRDGSSCRPVCLPHHPHIYKGKQTSTQDRRLYESLCFLSVGTIQRTHQFSLAPEKRERGKRDKSSSPLFLIDYRQDSFFTFHSGARRTP